MSKQTYKVTDSQGTRVMQLTERKALLKELNGATVTTTSTPQQKRIIRQWAAQGIGVN